LTRSIAATIASDLDPLAAQVRDAVWEMVLASAAASDQVLAVVPAAGRSAREVASSRRVFCEK
jgi:hypothetical protein